MIARQVMMLALAVAMAAAGCSSPEAARARGQGAGADVGNRGDPVEIGGKKEMFRGTPVRGPAR
jgi:hypothetical protein